MKKLKIAIIIFTIVVIILLITIFLSKTNKNELSDNNVNNEFINNTISEGYADESEVTTKENIELNEYERVNITNNYFTVETLIKIYITSIENEEYQQVYDMLSTDYIKSNNINLNNISKFITKTTEKGEMFYAKEMYWLEGTKVQTYSVYGEIWNDGNTKILDTGYFLVEIDSDNSTFAITPYVNEKYNSIKEIKLSRKENSIKINENNLFSYIKIDKENLLKKYLQYFQQCLLYYPNQAYDLLDADYKNKRFENKENFKKYINENKEYIYRSVLEKYSISNSNDIKKYIAIDNYDNYYTFKETAPMQFTVQLDNYTIMSKEDLVYYSKLDKFDKSKYNLTKVINMINTKDYNAIYNVLDKTFRANNFATVDQLKSYLKNNMYDFNVIEIENYDDETYEYYVFNCKITNMQNNNESKNMTIIINQTEGIEFTMSFSF